MRIVWTRPAMADLAALADFWEQRAPKKWIVILNAIVDKVGQLETQPRLGQQDLLLAKPAGIQLPVRVGRPLQDYLPRR